MASVGILFFFLILGEMFSVSYHWKWCFLWVYHESESRSVMSNSLWHHIVHRNHQATILEQIAYPFSSGTSQPKNWTSVSCIAGRFYTSWATRETPSLGVPYLGRFLLCQFLWRVFIIKWCWIFLKAFSVSIEMTIWFLFFTLLIWSVGQFSHSVMAAVTICSDFGA